jgi:hypothetical protein
MNYYDNKNNKREQFADLAISFSIAVIAFVALAIGLTQIFT